MSLGLCAEFRNFSISRLHSSAQKAIHALSKVDNAFKQALKSARPPPPSVDDVTTFVNQVAKAVLDDTMKATIDSKGWSGREVLHEEIVNKTIDKLNNYTR